MQARIAEVRREDHAADGVKAASESLTAAVAQAAAGVKATAEAQAAAEAAAAGEASLLLVTHTMLTSLLQILWYIPALPLN